MTTDTQAPGAVGERIRELCREFKLPTLASEIVGRFSDAGHADALPTLVEVLEQEAEDRRIRRVDRLRRASKLPAGKTWDTFEHERVPVKLRQQLVRLAEGDFAERGVNVLAFGMPGTGKTHAMCAIGHRLVQSGRSVLFIPAYRLVQDMLAAKRDLDLPRMLREAGQFRPAGDRRPGLHAAGRRGVGGAVHADSGALRAPLAGHHLQPGLLRVGEGVRQPHGDGGSNRQDRASLGHTGIRHAQLSDQCRAEPAGEGCVAPAKVIVARQNSCRVNYKLSYLRSAESTVREGVRAAKSIDASGKNS